MIVVFACFVANALAATCSGAGGSCITLTSCKAKGGLDTSAISPQCGSGTVCCYNNLIKCDDNNPTSYCGYTTGKCDGVFVSGQCSQWGSLVKWFVCAPATHCTATA